MDMIVTVPRAFAGQRLSDALFELGIPFLMPCGGAGRCGGCRVLLLDGEVYDKNGGRAMPNANGEIAACSVLVGREGCRVALPALKDGGGEELAGNVKSDARLAMALDIGTTTLSAALVDLDSRRVLGYRSALNPQAAFGADVMRRIEAARSGRLAELQGCLLKAISSLCEELRGREGRVEVLTVVGNPTMLHLFCGISPARMGTYPFTPEFLETRYLAGDMLMLPFERVILLPSASAFVGSDVMAGVCALGMTESDEPSLLLDLGTNGEMALWYKGCLYTASCAAGPAFEGGEISMGMGGVGGAVSRVYQKDGVYCYKTVGDLPARGICGAGLCDLAALLLDDGVIEKNGYLASPYRLCGSRQTEKGTLPSAPSAVVITPDDIHKLQLAKAAVSAGLSVLLREAGLVTEHLKQIFLAGGFGYFVSPDSAYRIGLLPRTFAYEVSPVGNTALRGAVMAALDEGVIAKIEALIQKTKPVSLAEHPEFSDMFMRAISF